MPKGISLHIGLNGVNPDNYDGWDGTLNACEADAEDMQALASLKGFSSTKLLTKDATRSNLMSALDQYANDLAAGDILFLSYSGHGGQVPDLNDDEPDGMDETWCLYDGEVIDDELDAKFATFKAGVRVIVLSDSCHSGTVLRDAYHAALASCGAFNTLGHLTNRVRAMPRQVADRVYRKNREFYDSLQSAIPKEIEDRVQASVLLISGCADNQTSQDGDANGLFTGTLLRVWKRGLFVGNYHSFCNRIVARMPPTQTPQYFRTGAPNRLFERQPPFTI